MGGIALTLAASTMFKPNFLLSVCGALGTILIVDLVRYRTLEAFKNIVIMGMTVFPSLAVLVVQYVLIYVSGSGAATTGIEVVWLSDLLWSGTAGHMFLKLFRSIAFLLVVVIIAMKEYKKANRCSFDIKIIFSILLFVWSLVIFSVFKETGSRSAHGNFGWAIPMGYYTMYLYIVPWFFHRLKESTLKDNISSADKVFFGAGVFLLLAHTVSGILYFCFVASGVSYYI